MVNRNDDDLTYEFPEDNAGRIFYKGIPFTGIVKEGSDYQEYKDGMPHGVDKTFHANGQLKHDLVYTEGKLVSVNIYYENRQLKVSNADGCYKTWSRDGVFIRKENVFYFLDGSLKRSGSYEQSNGKEMLIWKFYSRKGELLFKKYVDDNNYLERNFQKLTKSIEYDDNKLLENCFDYLISELKELDDMCELVEQDRIHNVFMWIRKIRETSKLLYFQLLNELMAHPDEYILNWLSCFIVYHSDHDHLDVENEKNAKAWELIRKEQNRKKNDERTYRGNLYL